MTRTVLSYLVVSDRALMAERLDTIAFLQRVKLARPRIAGLCAGCIAVLWGEVDGMEADRG